MECTLPDLRLDTRTPTLLHQVVSRKTTPALLLTLTLQFEESVMKSDMCPPHSGGFYPNPPAFDASAAYMPPPPYSAPLGQQPPHDPDLPSSAAGQSLQQKCYSNLSTTSDCSA